MGFNSSGSLWWVFYFVLTSSKISGTEDELWMDTYVQDTLGDGRMKVSLSLSQSGHNNKEEDGDGGWSFDFIII